MSKIIYSTKRAYVFVGDTNNGKTSTINTILSCLTNQNVQLYTKNGINASKCITIIHFIASVTHSPQVPVAKYKIKYNDTVNLFDDMERLQNKYNSVIESLSDYLDKYVHIFIPIYHKLLHNYVFIDIIGKTSDNITIYNNQLNKINLDYPNNIKIFVTKTLSIDMCTNYNNILLTHADKINYTENAIDFEIHKSIIADNPTKVNYVSNINHSIQIISGINNVIYNKHNIVHYLNKLIEQFKNNITIPTNQFLDHMLKYKYVNNIELFNEITKFNNNEILEETKKKFKFMVSLDEIKKKVKKFNNDIILMREHYKCYQKNGSGQRAQNYLLTSKLSLFGPLYEYVSNDVVCAKYMNDQKELYKNKIIALNNKINNEPKIINTITTEIPSQKINKIINVKTTEVTTSIDIPKIKKRSFLEI